MKRRFKIGDLVQLVDEASVCDVGHHDVGVVVRYANTWINLMKHKHMRWAIAQAARPSAARIRGHHKLAPRRANMWYLLDERFVVLWPARHVNLAGGGLKSYCEEVQLG